MSTQKDLENLKTEYKEYKTVLGEMSATRRNLVDLRARLKEKPSQPQLLRNAISKEEGRLKAQEDQLFIIKARLGNALLDPDGKQLSQEVGKIKEMIKPLKEEIERLNDELDKEKEKLTKQTDPGQRKETKFFIHQLEKTISGKYRDLSIFQKLEKEMAQAAELPGKVGNLPSTAPSSQATSEKANSHMMPSWSTTSAAADLSPKENQNLDRDSGLDSQHGP